MLQKSSKAMGDMLKTWVALTRKSSFLLVKRQQAGQAEHLNLFFLGSNLRWFIECLLDYDSCFFFGGGFGGLKKKYQMDHAVLRKYMSFSDCMLVGSVSRLVVTVGRFTISRWSSPT